jgi:hypothetical protein
MADNPFKVGDKIRVLPSPHTREEIHNEIGEVVEIKPQSYGTIISVKLPHHKVSSYTADFKWGFVASATLMERLALLVDAPTIKPSLRQEKPCQVCQKPNDVGVKSCWNCGNAPF